MGGVEDFDKGRVVGVVRLVDGNVAGREPSLLLLLGKTR